jgi:hypothetical protein
MKFQVPQFIEVEDKVFGPLTIKQFVYLAGGGGLSFLLYTFLPLPFFIKAIIILPVIGFAILLAFFNRINNKPFIFIVEAAFKYLTSSKLYLWKKMDRPHIQQQAPAPTDTNLAGVMVPKVSSSKLRDLTWSLDIHESIYSDQKQK